MVGVSGSGVHSSLILACDWSFWLIAALSKFKVAGAGV